MHFLYSLYALGILVSARVVYLIATQLASPLRSVPGPFWARWTRFWIMLQVHSREWHHENLKLHKKYGPIVRVAPGWYSIDDPDSMKTMYGPQSRFTKSEWYEAFLPPEPSKQTMFPLRDVKRHADMRRGCSNLYALSTVRSYEKYADSCVDVFIERMRPKAQHREAFDLGAWFQYFAFDVITEVTYGKPLGFLDKGGDIHGIISALRDTEAFAVVSGYLAEWHSTVWPLLAKLKGSGPAGRMHILDFVDDRVKERRAEHAETGVLDHKIQDDSIEDDAQIEDFLNKLLRNHYADPQKTTNDHIFTMSAQNIVAGSDTTTAALTGIVYHVVSNPESLAKLRKEIDDRDRGGHITFDQTQQMPYLQAVMKEGLRLHGVASHIQWRLVPAGGATICGRFFPAGSNVGTSTWVAHYNEQIYGEDATVFRPERWIEAQQEGGERLRRMEGNYMTWGMGSRTCLGRPIAMLEMSKVIVRLLQAFDLEIVGEAAEKGWHVHALLFARPDHFDVRLKSREV